VDEIESQRIVEISSRLQWVIRRKKREKWEETSRKTQKILTNIKPAIINGSEQVLTL
jgi:hypothetical protein